MPLTTQDFAGVVMDAIAGGRDLRPPRPFGEWVSYLTTQIVRRIANRWEAKYAPPSCRGRRMGE